METTYNASATELQQQVQALILLKAFDTLCAKAKGRFRIVPLKGIDLIRVLYADTLDRELKDIDLLVLPAEQAMDCVELLQRDGYRPEFSHALDNAALHKKKKVSMLAPSERQPHIDVHLALITKKFFSATINGFNQDAITRVKPIDDVVSLLDDVDRWLFLAAHLTFHFLEGDKWYRDLSLLWERFQEADVSTLCLRTKQYHFQRVVAAVLRRLQVRYPAIADQINIQQLLPDKSGQRFLRFIDEMTAHPEQLGHGFHLARYYWEFVFISDTRQRRQAFMHLLFPSLGNMQNIYRCHTLGGILLYVPHVLMNVLGLLLFSIKYAIASNAR